jgi:acylphosphatase
MSDAAFLVHVVIRGQVQGIGFRAWVADEARAARLNGYVRNRRDGTVEAVFSGPQADVEAMLVACWRGPPGSQVTAIDPVAAEVEPLAEEGFEVRSTI